MTTIICTIILLLAAIVLLGVKVLFIKGAKFPSSHVHDNKELRARGITCVSGNGSKIKNDN